VPQHPFQPLRPESRTGRRLSSVIIASSSLARSDSIVRGRNRLKLTILSMHYFDDIEFLGGGVHPRYSSHLATTARNLSLELCSAGGMYMHTDDGPRIELPAPAVFWHLPGHRYRYGPLAAPGWWHHHWVIVRGPRAERIAAHALAPLSPQHALALDDERGLHRLFVEVVGLVHGLERRQGEAAAALERILAALAGLAAPRGERTGMIEDLAATMARRPFEPWDADAEARRLGLSVAHFRRLFAAVAGAPPARHLLALRMRAVAAALIDDRRPVKEVATGFGFADQAVFTRSFARVLGCTPRRWRAMQVAQTVEKPAR
jgi:AraC-like DNA-binding protein